MSGSHASLSQKLALGARLSMTDDLTLDLGDESAGAYQVLARRYRPQDFDSLIGQEAMVRTLRNAFQTDRIAHAFILSGIRGVGKTTTARIIARCLNCVGPDGAGGPTVTPCGTCEACRGISESRFVDVIEIDAASHTQVDKTREMIESARHRPNWGRYKVYIIDEAHMLTNQSFNALLKILEEPPPHVKFVLATTEIRKVPLTVLSRCQRFDLRRVESHTLTEHLESVASDEGIKVEADAVALMVRAAEGSIRDGLSLLDQAIAHGGEHVTATNCREMLGLADGGRVLDLFEQICRGRTAEALSEFDSQYSGGADPAAVLGALAETCHGISILRVAPGMARNPVMTPDEAARGKKLAESLTPSVLVRFWQILERSLDEMRRSGSPRLTADMAIIRLTHASTLPTPDKLVQELSGKEEVPRSPSSPGGNATPAPKTPETQEQLSPVTTEVQAVEDIAALARQNGELLLLHEIEHNLRAVEVSEGNLVFVPGEEAAPSLAKDLVHQLQIWTGRNWNVRIARDGGGETIHERRMTVSESLHDQVMNHPEVQAVLKALPEARITGFSAHDNLQTI